MRAAEAEIGSEDHQVAEKADADVGVNVTLIVQDAPDARGGAVACHAVVGLGESCGNGDRHDELVLHRAVGHRHDLSRARRVDYDGAEVE